MYSCGFCGKVYSQSSSIKSHLLIHSGERPYQCSFCSKTFRQKSTKTRHETTTHTQRDKYSCPYCPKKFSRKDSLASHHRVHLRRRFMKDHSDEELFQFYKANQAGKVYNSDKEISPGDSEIKESLNPDLELYESVENSVRNTLENNAVNQVSSEEISTCQTSSITIDENELEECLEHDNVDSSVLDQRDVYPENSVAVASENDIISSDPMIINGFQSIVNGTSTNSQELIILPSIDDSEYCDSKLKDRLHQCRYCNKYYAHAASRDSHELIHTGERPYSCKFCAKSFRQKSTKTRHEISTHMRLKLFHCRHCFKEFSRKDCLTSHERTHSKLDLTNCYVCSRNPCSCKSVQVDFRTTEDESFKQSSNTPSNGETSSKSNDINYQADDIPTSELKNSSDTVVEQKPIIIDLEVDDENLASIDTEPDCASNITTTNGESGYSSEVSNVYDKDLIKLPTVSSSKAFKGLPPYKCRFCDKSYSQIASRDSHELVHTGERPFSCLFCSRTFRQKSTKTRHEAIHTCEKMYSCNYCPKRFTRKDALSSHVKSHYRKAFYPCGICLGKDCTCRPF